MEFRMVYLDGEITGINEEEKDSMGLNREHLLKFLSMIEENDLDFSGESRYEHKEKKLIIQGLLFKEKDDLIVEEVSDIFKKINIEFYGIAMDFKEALEKLRK